MIAKHTKQISPQSDIQCKLNICLYLKIHTVLSQRVQVKIRQSNRNEDNVIESKIYLKK